MIFYLGEGHGYIDQEDGFLRTTEEDQVITRS